MTSAGLEVGIQLPEVEFEASWSQTRELAVLAEAVGLDSVWVGDHLLYEDARGRRGPLECWAVLAAVAAVTDRVAIGPLVAALPFHNPAVLAKTIATIDEISRGRLIVGVGAGWNRVEFEAFGLPFDQRVGRFAESFEILRRLLAGERVVEHGRFVQADGAELLPRPSRQIPLMIGSNGRRMLSVALPHVTHWNTWYADFHNDPELLPSLVQKVDRAWHAAGRAGERLVKTVALHVSLTDDPRTRPGQPISGSDREVAGRLREVAGCGVDHVQLVLDPPVPAAVERAGSIKRTLSDS